MGNDEIFNCEHCGREVDMHDITDCDLDDTGHCILCGMNLMFDPEIAPK
jgi:hypothetical protein